MDWSPGFFFKIFFMFSRTVRVPYECVPYVCVCLISSFSKHESTGAYMKFCTQWKCALLTPPLSFNAIVGLEHALAQT